MTYGDRFGRDVNVVIPAKPAVRKIPLPRWQQIGKPLSTVAMIALLNFAARFGTILISVRGIREAGEGFAGIHGSLAMGTRSTSGAS